MVCCLRYVNLHPSDRLGLLSFDRLTVVHFSLLIFLPNIGVTSVFLKRPVSATSWALFSQSQCSNFLAFKRTLCSYDLAIQSSPSLYLHLKSSVFFLAFCIYYFCILKLTFKTALFSSSPSSCLFVLRISETLMLSISIFWHLLWNTFDKRKKEKTMHIIKNLFIPLFKKKTLKTHNNQQSVFVIISMQYLFVL